MASCRASRRSAASPRRNENGKPKKNYPLSARRMLPCGNRRLSPTVTGATFRIRFKKPSGSAKGKEQAFGMVSDMLAAYPDEFDALLNKSRAKKAVPYYKGNSHGNDRGGK